MLKPASRYNHSISSTDFLPRRDQLGCLSERGISASGGVDLSSEPIVKGILSATRAGTSPSKFLVRSDSPIVRSDWGSSLGSVDISFGWPTGSFGRFSELSFGVWSFSFFRSFDVFDVFDDLVMGFRSSGCSEVTDCLRSRKPHPRCSVSVERT